MRNKYIYITILTLLGLSSEAAAQALSQQPRLVVTIAIDQLRTDRMEAFSSLYAQNGLKRLMREGVMYSNASYNFTPVDRASAIASLSTGSTPYYNGVTGVEWLDRNTLRPHNIINDKDNGMSPVQMQTSSLGDELKIATDGQGKVFAFATDAERAILSAGHAADGAVWFTGGKWNLATYYTPENQWLSWYSRQYKPTEEINRNVTDIALRCVEQSGIGQDDIADLLYVSYDVGSDAASYQMLDYNIAVLLNGILRKINKERVLFVITGTGTTEEEREDDNEKYRIPTGKFYINRTANLLNMYLGAIYGSAQYVETSFNNQLFLNRKLIDKRNIDVGEVLRRSQEFILQLSGVRKLYTANQLMTSESYQLERIRNGFNIEKCGDLIIEIAPGWQLVNEDTHTTSVSRASNIPFPIIFFGQNIKPQSVHTPVTVDRIAPTVARAIRIRAPNACSTEPLF